VRRAANPPYGAGAGFTLLELLVVIAIVALVAAVAVPHLAKPSDGVRLQATARELASALWLTRSMAIRGGTEAALVIDVDKHTFESPAVVLKSFASDVVAELKVAEPERLTPSRGSFRFFPDGSSTGGDVVLRLSDKALRICVHWITGQPREGETC
jgi:general secretion pathway protein H